MHRKINIDWIRLLAACMVIAIHTYPFFYIHAEFDFLFTLVFCRIAVPIFLMITGYYVIQKSFTDFHYLLKYTKKIAIIYGIAILFYLPINLYGHQFDHMNLLSLLQMVVIDGTFYHLWYFPALILGLWIVYGLIKKWKEPYIGILLIILYLIGLFGDSYYGIIENTFFQGFYDMVFQFTTYTRNGLFYAPIFLYIGYLFAKTKEHNPSKYTWLCFIFSILFMEIEGYLLNAYGLQRHTSMYVMLIPTSIFLFSLLLPYQKNTNSKVRTISTLVYIIHPMCIIGIRGVVKILHLERWMFYKNFLLFLLTIVTSIVAAYLITLCLQKIKKITNYKFVKLKK